MDDLPTNDDSEEEVEEDSAALDETLPMRYSISSYGADYPVDSLVSRLESGAIYVPTFQRGFVWSVKQASRFMESLLLGLPVPGIFLSRQPETQKLIVIDGQQRLRTLQFFYDGVFGPSKKEFALDLSSVDEINRFEKMTYETLSDDDRTHLNDVIIHATVIKQDEPSDGQSSVYSIFERLNTGGVQLAPQEIRASVFHGSFSDLLRGLNTNLDWRKLFGPVSSRMRDQELILRFFAFLYFRDEYHRPMKDFLNRYMDRNHDLEPFAGRMLREVFDATVAVISEHIGPRAFRIGRAINAAVFDSVMVAIAHRLEHGPIEEPELLIIKHGELLEDNAFKSATTRATADEQSVESRLAIATAAFANVP